MNDLEDFENIEDKYILSDAYFLHKTIERALAALSNGINSGKFEDGLVVKNLEVNQAVEMAKAVKLFDDKELKDYLAKYEDNNNSNDKLDKLISDAKKSSYILGFILQKIHSKRPKMIKGVI